jgi:hypothetical protein
LHPVGVARRTWLGRPLHLVRSPLPPGWVARSTWLFAVFPRRAPERLTTYFGPPRLLHGWGGRGDVHGACRLGPFAELGGSGQKTLYKCLSAYSTFDEAVGYCQGMNFVVAMFVLQLSEEKAFRVFAGLMFHHGGCSLSCSTTVGARSRVPPQWVLALVFHHSGCSLSCSTTVGARSPVPPQWVPAVAGGC